MSLATKLEHGLKASDEAFGTHTLRRQVLSFPGLVEV
jgi:hypothetical protein